LNGKELDTFSDKGQFEIELEKKLAINVRSNYLLSFSNKRVDKSNSFQSLLWVYDPKRTEISATQAY